MSVLARETGLSTSYLSKIINTNSDYNFSDFINNFRIEKAKKLLADAEYNNYTYIAIGYECGFNSKSTFYTAFKKFTGQTPSIYKQNSIAK